jgi:hypothetical protein
MSRMAVLIRTHYVDGPLLALAERIKSGGAFDVYIVADETGGVLDCGGAPKISLTAETIAGLGLYDGAPKVLWRCGDYGYYAARQALPQYDGFWMIEPDVRLKSQTPCDILARFPGPDEVDFLAGRLRPAETDWDWTMTMDPAEGPVWRCLFAVTRLSARAIDLLYQARRRASAEHVSLGRNPKAWANDEAFVCTTMARSHLIQRDLNDFGQVYNEVGFSFWFPISEREVEATGQDGWIYHPVLSGQTYFLKLCRLAVRHGALDELEQMVERTIGLEWSEEEARGHLRGIALLRSQLAIAAAPPPLAAE